MSYSTFNGWTIIPPPAAPGFRSVVLRMNDTVASTRSPFTAMEQVQLWPGADWWEVELELPPLLPMYAAPWQAWLAALQGKNSVFEIGDPSRTAPQLPIVGSEPVVNNGGGGTNNLTGATTLVTAGWKANQARLLLPGDYLQVGYRLHMVLQAIGSDSGGNASINVWPSLREQPSNGAQAILKCPKGLFRLAANAREVSVAVTGLAAIGLKCVEAR